MFAKVFSQIFDSSIAEDYNCRRMFMDLLVLADSDGVVDMTPEAISRRTNVPMDEVVKYVKELCQPDAKSRSQLHDGKRLIPLDTNRDWGWIIVNYAHYRKVRDEEARREYFRSAMRKSRKKKREGVKDKGLTNLTKVNNVQPPASASASLSASDSKRKAKEISEVIQYASEIGVSRSDAVAFFDSMEAGGWTRGGKALKDWKAHLRSYKAQGWLASQRNGRNGFTKPKERAPVYPKLSERREPTQEEISKARAIARRESDAFRQRMNGGERIMAEDTKEKPNKPTSPTPVPKPTNPDDHGNK